jgi:hypothetical protein
MKKPLCFTCRHGLCVRQLEKATIVVPPDESDKEGWEDKSTDPKHTEFKHDGYQAFCFWILTKNTNSDPIQVAEITECNRYEKDSTKKGLTGGDPVVE